MPMEKILVVEDEGIVAEDIKRRLQAKGYTVPAIAATGEEAIRKTEEHNPDLVLMDIMLQGEMDGIDAANQINSRFNIPIVYLTAYSDEGMLERAKITEPIGYILKPYNEKELHATIEMALYQYKSGRRKRELMYREIIESAPDPIIITNARGQITQVNTQTEKAFGYNREELIGRPIETLIPERFREAHVGRRDEYYLNPRTRSMGVCLDLYGRRKDGSEFPADISLAPINTDEGLLVISDIRDITDRKQAEEQIHHLAYYDVLTALPNRLLLRDDIDRAISAARRENRTFALFIMNLNRFKEVNNTLGYQNGDIILQEVARRLQDALSDANTIARMGGDDFAVLMANTDANSAPQTLSKIMGSLDAPFSLGGLSLNISSSTGISVFPGHGEDADTLIRRAYIAMDEAKTTESGFYIYTPESDQFVPERLALMGELRSAIGLNQLFLLYQPKVDLKTGRTLGAEALVRWQHPKSGIIPPDQFISLAERCGLIRQLTFWVLREALRQARGWQSAGHDLSIAVNLSVRSLQTPMFLDQIKGLLATWGVDPGMLRLEITESIIMSDPELALEIITQLTLMGIRFSIDDFGTGYSSLKYLQRLPVDEIKIDKSFVMKMLSDENSLKIVRSTIELAHSLGRKVTAEGVESREVFDKLTALGCDAAQGYFISKPIPHPELTAWLGKQG